MKVDLSTIKLSATDPAAHILRSVAEFKEPATDEDFIAKLASVTEWNSHIGKMEMGRWVDVLDRMDGILERAVSIDENGRYLVDHDEKTCKSVLTILRFTNLLFENTSARSTYASADRLLDLLRVETHDIVIRTLQLFQCICKRSHFMRSRISAEQKTRFENTLLAIAQSWFGKLKTIETKQILDAEFTVPNMWPYQHKRLSGERMLTVAHNDSSISLIRLIKNSARNEAEQEALLADEDLRARLRVLRCVSNVEKRVEVMTLRMLAASTLIYSRTANEDVEVQFAQNAFIQECAEIAKLSDYPHKIADKVDEMRSEALRTLTSIAAQEKFPRLQTVVDVLNANSYHGFLAVTTRKCVEDLCAGSVNVQLCTALFSLLYHISSTDPGGEAITSCGLVPTLLSVVSSTSLPVTQLSFVTRCVRIIDIITSVDPNALRQAEGIDTSVERLVFEVDECRKENPFIIDVSNDTPTSNGETVVAPPCLEPCYQQRAALIKSILTFLKRVAQDNHFAEPVRRLMMGKLPNALIHIISNVDYYTTSLYQNAVQLVTYFIFQEPAQLAMLQTQHHLPYVILQSLLRKEITATKDLIINMLNTFNALCLNKACLDQLIAFSPFDQFFKMILSVKFLQAVRRKRPESGTRHLEINFRSLADAGVTIGNALDDLLRHQQALRPHFIKALMSALKRLQDISKKKQYQLLMALGRTPKSSRRGHHFDIAQDVAESNRIAYEMQNGGIFFSRNYLQVPETASDDEDEDDSENEMETEQRGSEEPPSEDASDEPIVAMDISMEPSSSDAPLTPSALPYEPAIDHICADGTRQVPLGEYLMIISKMIETILTGNHLTEFVKTLVQEKCIDTLFDLTQTEAIRLQIAHSQIPSQLATIIRYLMHAAPSESCIIASALKRLARAVSPASKLIREEGRLSYLPSLGATAASEIIASVTYSSTILLNLAKNLLSATTNMDELKVRFVEAMRDKDGTALIRTLETVSSILCNDVAVTNALCRTSHVGKAIQTDDADKTLVAEPDSPAVPTSGQVENSVDTETVPLSIPQWRQMGIHQDEYDFWTKHKDLITLLNRAHTTLNQVVPSIVKTCLRSNPRAQRRENFMRDFAMTDDAKHLTEFILNLIAASLRSTYGKTDVLTNAYALNLLEQIFVTVLEERRNSQLPLLVLFYKSGCHQAFCQMLVKMIAPQFHQSAPCIRASLESLTIQWMRIADRLANRQTTVGTRPRFGNSSHDFPPHLADKYHCLVQTDLFAVFNQLFAKLREDDVDLKTYMVAAETAISVYKEVFQNLIALKQDASSSGASENVMENPQVKFLIEMGFDRNEIHEALEEFSSVSEATEYLISRQRVQRQNLQQAMESAKAITSAAEKGECSRENACIVIPLESVTLDIDIDDAVSKTCNEMLPLCNRLMDAGSDLVYSSADLVIGVIDCADKTWKAEGLIRSGMCEELQSLAKSLQLTPDSRTIARSLTTRLHFACLLWEHVAEDYLEILKDYNLHETLIDLAKVLAANEQIEFHIQEKGVIGSLFLWIDQYAKCTKLVRRRKLLLETLNGKSLTWMFLQYEERLGSRGSFSNFDTEITQHINKAFIEGKLKVAFKMNRKEYVITFTDMMMKLENGNSSEKHLVWAELPDDIEVDLPSIVAKERELVFSHKFTSVLVDTLLVVVSRVHMHQTVAHSLLLLFARLTGVPDIAEAFLGSGALKSILEIQCLSSPSTSILVTIIVRNLIDDTSLLTPVFERSIRSVAGNGANTLSNNVAEFANRYNPLRNPSLRDWRASLTMLNPLLLRDPELYERIMEYTATVSNGRLVPAPAKPATETPQTSESVSKPAEAATSTVRSTTNVVQQPINQKAHRVIEMLLREVLHGVWTVDSVSETNNRMVSKGLLIRVTAELIRGYPSIANVICDVYAEAGASHTILYPLIDTIIGDLKDNETHTAMRTLIATLSACNYAGKAMDTLLTEIRAVVADLHTKNYAHDVLFPKISELAAVVIMMKEACPTTSIKAPNNRDVSANLMVRLMHRKRVCNDLVRSLTLIPVGKKEAIETLNNVIRSLEVITHAINTLIPPHLLGEKATRDAPAQAQDVSFSAAPEANQQANEMMFVEEADYDVSIDDSDEEEDMYDDDHDDDDDDDDEEDDDDDDDEEDSQDEEMAEHADDEDDVEDDVVEGNDIVELESLAGSIIDQRMLDAEEAEEVQSNSSGEHHDEHDDVEEDADGDDEDDDDEDEEEDDEDGPEEEHVDDQELHDVTITADEEEDQDFDGIDGMLYNFNDMMELFQDESMSMRTMDLFVHQGFERTVSFGALALGRAPTHVIRAASRAAAIAPAGRAVSVTDHPLMLRPTYFPVNDNQRATQRDPNSTLMFDHRPARFGGGFPFNAISTVWHHGRPLHRQNAIRPPRLFDVQALRVGQDLQDEAMQPIFFSPEHLGHMAHLAQQHVPDRRWAHASAPLDRLNDGMRLLDAHSAQFLCIIVNAVISKKAFAKAKAASEESKAQAPTDAEQEAAPAAVLAGENEEEPMDTDEPVSPHEQPIAEEELAEVGGVQQNLEDEPMTTPSTEEHNSPIVMETSGDVNEEPQNETSAAETEARTQEQQQQDGAPVEQAPTPVAPDAPTSGMVRVPEAFRDVLGDIEIPQGIDPEFIAALPEEMRQEVIRDFMRQMRAEQAASAAGGAQQPPQAAAANLGVEPVDQEFLNALPLELQREVLEQQQRLRDAEAAAAANPPSENDGDHAVALIESLAPALRAQVLADADDSVLAALPPALVAEARRLRAQRQLRLQNRATPAGLRAFRRFGANAFDGGIRLREDGQVAPGTSAESNTVQILDRDTLIILSGLFFVDSSRFAGTRLHKVVRSICSHPASCDYFVAALLSILEKSLDATADDEEVCHSSASRNTHSWTDGITLSLSVTPECAFTYKSDGTVVVNPQVAPNVGRAVLDALIMLSKNVAHRFLPLQLRNLPQTLPAMSDPPHTDKFWRLLHDVGNRKTHIKDQPMNEIRYNNLDTSPLGKILALLNKPIAVRNVELQAKVLKTCVQIFAAMPDNAHSLLRTDAQVEAAFLAPQLDGVIKTLSHTCSSETLTDARNLLVQAIRVLSPATARFIFKRLYEAIEELASQLKPQIVEFMEQLANMKPSADQPDTAPSTSSDAPPVAHSSHDQSLIRHPDRMIQEQISLTRGTNDSNRPMFGRFDADQIILHADPTGRSMHFSASNCPELQVPAVSQLTDKKGVQFAFLQSLQTVVKIRESLRAINEKRQKELNEYAKKLAEVEKKEAETQAKKQDEENAKIEAEASVAATATVAAGTSSEAAPTAAIDIPGPSTSTQAVQPQPSTSGTTEKPQPLKAPPRLLDIPELEERLISRLESMSSLWPMVSTCLERLGHTSDPHAPLVLQPVAQAFFLVHAVHSTNPQADHDDPDTKKLIQFAEQHRTVLNQVLRQDPGALTEGGPFTVLTQFPKLLDFDVKRKFFRKQLSAGEDPRIYRRDDVAIRVSRAHIFSESYRELFRLRPHEWKYRFYVVFDGEEGQDAGGLLREWFSVITREIFNPNYALFITAPGDRVTYMINKSSYVNPEHLDYFKFVGRIIAKAIYDNKLLDCYFTRAFYKHILNLPVKPQDLESEDPSFYKSLSYMLTTSMKDLMLDLNFTVEVEEFGVRDSRELKPNGQNIIVTDENKEEYVQLVCQMKMTGSIRKQLDAFLAGFYEIIPKNLISMFNEQELELLISGLPDIDIDDLAANTEYRSYTKNSPQIQWFWRALRSFEPEDRAKFLQFVTGTSKVPLQGFSSLEGMNGTQKFSIHMDTRSGDRLPAAHTCFNQLDLPEYESYERLRDSLLVAIRECTEGFGFA